MSSNLPKYELENVNFCPSLLGQKFFVRFLGELKKTKSRFEINWPLEGTKIESIISFLTFSKIREGKLSVEMLDAQFACPFLEADKNKIIWFGTSCVLTLCAIRKSKKKLDPRQNLFAPFWFFFIYFKGSFIKYVDFIHYWLPPYWHTPLLL